MTQDVETRLSMFSQVPVKVHRLALTEAQIAHYNPPPNPVKVTDSRSSAYIQQFGEMSWELDALEPVVLGKILSDAIEQLRDLSIWEESLRKDVTHWIALPGSSCRRDLLHAVVQPCK